MFGTLKRKVLTWSAITSLAVISSSCGENSSVKKDAFLKETTTIVGRTQGTTYTVIIVDKNVKLAKKELDAELRKFDLSLSTYIDESVISRINTDSGKFVVSDPTGFFKTCYIESQQVFKKTNGLFDPSTM